MRYSRRMDDWISAAEAHALLSKVSPYTTAEAICTRANDGVVAAKAKIFIIGDHRSTDAAVPDGFWWARGHAALDQNWPLGDFETWIDHHVHCRAYGVEFLRRDILAMLPASRAAENKPRPASQGNYAPASRCLDELQKQLGTTKKDAANHVARFCGAGLVEARCASFWWEVTSRFGVEEEDFGQVAIPIWWWEKCASGPDAILDWQSGTFAGRGQFDDEMRKVRIRGAEFDISGIVDLEIMLREQETPDVKSASPFGATLPLTRGGHPKSENWANWIAELVSFVHEQGIPNGSGAEGQDALIGMIEERLAARNLESPSRSTVQAAVRAALLRLRSAGN